MNKKTKKHFILGLILLFAFILWTICVQFVDVQTIGPENTSIGFGALNKVIHDSTGVHMYLYTMTDWMSLIPFAFVFIFACLGLIQWIQRKSLLKVDCSLLVLGGFYFALLLFYVFFEISVVNFRPILIDGHLEASYPSSTTMLMICICSTTIMQLNQRIQKPCLRLVNSFLLISFCTFVVTCRFISGVHWFSDIVGGILLSASLVMFYSSLSGLK